MKIAATKAMVRELNMQAKRAGGRISFHYVTMTTDLYRLIIGGDIFAAYDWGDFNQSTGKFRAITATYPGDYYASPQHITTEELNGLYRVGDTIDSYTARVIDYMAI